MENASKALIIAGAILLSILLISLGIMIYNQAQNTVNNSGMSQAELQAFNNKFLKYESDGGKNGSEVKSLVNEAISSNADPTNPGVTVSLVAKSASGGTTTSTIVAPGNTTATTVGINLKAAYKVSLTYSSGRVSTITVTEE